MVEIADLRDCAPSGLFYGGRAGQKEGILIEGEPWIAKYPRTTRDLVGKHLPSYTSSPVSEYLGSHIYGLLGIPVHETMLGYRAGKIVCACRDFTFPNARLFEFKEIKNALSDDDAGFNSAPSDGEVVLLGDVLAAIKCFAAAVDMEAIDTYIYLEYRPGQRMYVYESEDKSLSIGLYPLNDGLAAVEYLKN